MGTGELKAAEVVDEGLKGQAAVALGMIEAVALALVQDSAQVQGRFGLPQSPAVEGRGRTSVVR